MQADTFRLTSSADGLSLYAYRWLPDSRPRAVIQIAHGMAEHAGRYARLAAALVKAGYAVYAHDHRGHGHTAPAEALGLFADTDGWNKLVADLWQMNRRIAADFPGVPIVLLGHSMGSFAAQRFLCLHDDALAACILSGSSNRPNAPSLAIALLISRFERWRLGPRGRSVPLVLLSFGTFNRAFKPMRTYFDWLSRDPAEVDKYVADPLCGFLFTTQSWIDLFHGMRDMGRPKDQARIPKDLPIRIIAGGRDPVSAQTKGLNSLMAAYAKAGLRRVTHQFYPDARHELFQELNRDAVTADLIHWLDEVLPIWSI